jgi:hypothetical protein
MTIHRRLPLPQAQAFVICREIWHNDRSNEFTGLTNFKDAVIWSALASASRA